MNIGELGNDPGRSQAWSRGRESHSDASSMFPFDKLLRQESDAGIPNESPVPDAPRERAEPVAFEDRAGGVGDERERGDDRAANENRSEAPIAGAETPKPEDPSQSGNGAAASEASGRQAAAATVAPSPEGTAARDTRPAGASAEVTRLAQATASQESAGKVKAAANPSLPTAADQANSQVIRAKVTRNDLISRPTSLLSGAMGNILQAPATAAASPATAKAGAQADPSTKPAMPSQHIAGLYRTTDKSTASAAVEQGTANRQSPTAPAITVRAMTGQDTSGAGARGPSSTGSSQVNAEAGSATSSETLVSSRMSQAAGTGGNAGTRVEQFQAAVTDGAKTSNANQASQTNPSGEAGKHAARSIEVPAFETRSSSSAPIETAGLSTTANTAGSTATGTAQGVASSAARAASQSAQTPLANQVAVQIHKGFEGGRDRIQIKLHPAELGRVEVRMELSDDGALRAVISADKPETFELLQRDARQLERALQDAGLRTDNGSLSFHKREGEGSHARNEAAPGAAAPADETDEESPLETAPSGSRHDGNLDISV